MNEHPNAQSANPAAPEPETRQERAERAASGVLRAAGGLAASVGRAADGEHLTKDAVLEAVGGVRGVIESALPSLVFVCTYSLTAALYPSAIAPLVIGVLALIIRIVQHQPLMPALSGLIGTALCVVLTTTSGRAETFFVPGLVTNVVWSVVLLTSVLLRWPLIGIGVGFWRGDLFGWRHDPRTFRVMRLITLMWLGLFVLRLAVQLPLYLSGQVALLGAARIVMGVPLFALVIVFSWLLVRATVAPAGPAPEPDAPAPGFGSTPVLPQAAAEPSDQAVGEHPESGDDSSERPRSDGA